MALIVTNPLQTIQTMNESTTEDTLLHVMARRWKVVNEIDSGTLDKRNLASSLDVSRTTINRAIRDLEEVGVLQVRGSSFDLSRYGQFVFRGFEEFRSLLDDLDDGMTVVRSLPQDSDIPIDLIRGATFHAPVDHAPQEGFRPLLESINRASRVQALVPVLTPTHVSVFKNVLSEPVQSTHLYLDDSLQEIITGRHSELYQSADASDSFVLRFLNATPPHGAYFLDQSQVWVTVYHEGGALAGMLTNESDRALDWASHVFTQLDDQRQ